MKIFSAEGDNGVRVFCPPAFTGLHFPGSLHGGTSYQGGFPMRKLTLAFAMIALGTLVFFGSSNVHAAGTGTGFTARDFSGIWVGSIGGGGDGVGILRVESDGAGNAFPQMQLAGVTFGGAISGSYVVGPVDGSISLFFTFANASPGQLGVITGWLGADHGREL